MPNMKKPLDTGVNALARRSKNRKALIRVIRATTALTPEMRTTLASQLRLDDQEILQLGRELEAAAAESLALEARIRELERERTGPPSAPDVLQQHKDTIAAQDREIERLRDRVLDLGTSEALSAMVVIGNSVSFAAGRRSTKDQPWPEEALGATEVVLAHLRKIVLGGLHAQVLEDARAEWLAKRGQR